MTSVELMLKSSQLRHFHHDIFNGDDGLGRSRWTFTCRVGPFPQSSAFRDRYRRGQTPPFPLKLTYTPPLAGYSSSQVQCY